MNLLVIAYLVAIVAANWIVSVFGPAMSVLTAFAAIGLVITTRDRLHDLWGDSLRLKMGALILGGSLLSFLLGGGVQRIAIASGVAFLLSETIDAIAYHALRNRSWYQRANGSNTVSAAVDSIVFPILAFGGLMPLITLGQFAAKVFGGAIWSLLLKPRRLAAALAVFVIPAGMNAQSVSVGFGEYHNEFVTQTVIEAVGLMPLEHFTPNVIVSWDVHGDGKPVVLPQIGRDLIVNYPVIIGADVGVSAGPWDDYGRWEKHVSVRSLAFIDDNWKVITIVSFQPWNEWARSVVVKLDRALW